MTTISNTDYQFDYQVNRDLVYYFDENRVEIIYTQPGTNIKTRHHILVANLSTEKLCVKRVLSCNFYGEPKLLIVCGDSNNKICFFWYCVATNTSKAIDFEASVVGNITQAKMTKALFEVDYVYKAKAPEKKKCYALVLGMQDGSSVLFLLNIDLLSNISVSFKYLSQEEGDDVGHVTSIYILPQDADDKRMGHHDPQILLGYSKGAIRAYRFRTTVYSYKASRITSPIDLSQFTEYPGHPITHLSCARTYNSLKLIVSFVQEKPNDAEFENAQAYVKLIEFNGTKKNAIKVFHPPIQSAYIAEAHVMPHYEDSFDIIIVLYSSLLRTFTISVWNLDSKKIMRHMLEKKITESRCFERLESAEQTKPDNNYLLKNPEKIIEFAFRGHAVGLKRKATIDFFKESLEALVFPNKREKLLCKGSKRTELGDHYFYKNPEMVIESASSIQAVSLKRKATVDCIDESFYVMDFPHKRQKTKHENSSLDDNDEETSISKDKKEESKKEEVGNELAQDEVQEKTDIVKQYSDAKEETNNVIQHDSIDAGGVSAGFEVIKGVKEPLLTESEITEEIMESVYAESDMMEEMKEPFTTEAKEQSDVEAIEKYIDKQEEDLAAEIEISKNSQGSSICASQIESMSLDKSQTWMDFDFLETEDYMEEDGSFMIEDHSFIRDESKDKLILYHDEKFLGENDSDKQNDDNGYDNMIEDEKALDTGYAEEVAGNENMDQDKKEQTYFDSFVFQCGDQDDETDSFCGGTIDEDSKEKEEGVVTEDEKDFYEQDTEGIQTSEDKECSTKEEYSHVGENTNTIDSPQVIDSSDEELGDGYVEEREYNDAGQNDHDSITEHDDLQEATGMNEENANEDEKITDDDNGENKHRETFENGDEFESYQEDQVEEDSDEYFDAVERYDEIENVEETEKEVEEDCVDCSDEEDYVDCPGEEDYVDCPGKEENFPVNYDYVYDKYSSAIEEDDKQKIKPLNGSINLISDGDNEEMDMGQSSSTQLLGELKRKIDESRSVLGSVQSNENTSVEGTVKQRPSLAELSAAYKWDHYEWGKNNC